MKGRVVSLTTILFIFLQIIAGGNTSHENSVSINAEKLFHMSNHTIVDIRNYEEYAKQHIYGAISIPFNQCELCFLHKFDEYRNESIVLYDKNGSKSERAVYLLINNGFKAYYLDGGIDSWIANGFPTETANGFPAEKGEEKYYCGCIPLKNVEPKEIIEIGEYPPVWNWKNVEYNGIRGDWTTPARDQKACGSCWAFAAMGALEAIVNIREGFPDIDVDLSEQYLLSCPPNSGGCSGWNAYFAYEYIAKNGGALLESCFPYGASDIIPCSDKCSDWEEKLVPIVDYGWYMNVDDEFIKYMIYNHGPVVATMKVYEDFYEYEEGVYRHTYGNFVGWHQVVIIGYDDEQRCWICKNSWGRYWGEDGFFRIAYGECEIGCEIIYADYDENALNWPPIADAGDGYYGDVGEPIYFDGSGTLDVDDNIVSWEWDFGDGNTSHEQNPVHIYPKKGIYSVKLTVVDSEGERDTDETAVFIDVWDAGNCWVYETKAYGDTEYFFPISFKFSMKNFVLQVENESENEYTLSFEGKIRGYGKISLNILGMPFNISFLGILPSLKMEGEIKFYKFGYGIEKIDLYTKGIAFLLTLPIPLLIPVPFHINVTVNFESPYILMAVAPEIGKCWETPITNASAIVNISSFFGIFTKSFAVDKIPLFVSIDMECVSKETVEVPAGTYEAYKIVIFEGIELYYSPEINNLVKLQISEEFENICLISQLKSLKPEK